MELLKFCGVCRLILARGNSFGRGGTFDALHARVPIAQLRVRAREFVMARVEIILDDAKEIEIDEERAISEEKLFVVEHLLARQEGGFDLRDHLLLVFGPLVEAAAAELALFVADEQEAVGFGNLVAPIDVVEFEPEAFDVVLDVAPEDLLDADPFAGKEIELIFFVDVFGDDLGGVAGFENDRGIVFEDGNLVVPLAGDFPDEGAVAIGDVADFEFGAGEFEDAPRDDAERAPRKLNQLDHFCWGQLERTGGRRQNDSWEFCVSGGGGLGLRGVRRNTEGKG